jgi:hypothetical protein
MADEPENLTLRLLQDLRADIAKGFQDVKEEFERVYVEIADVKAEVIKCRLDVAGANHSSKEAAVRLTLLEKRVKALEEARPEA